MQVIRKEVDAAGKTRVLVLDDAGEIRMLKFQEDPDGQTVVAAAEQSTLDLADSAEVSRQVQLAIVNAELLRLEELKAQLEAGG